MQNYHTLLIIQINLNILNHFRGRWPFSSRDKKGIGALASLSKHQLSFCCRSMFMGYLSHRFPLSNICVLSDKFTYSSVSSCLLDFLRNIANEDGQVNEDVSNPLPDGVFYRAELNDNKNNVLSNSIQNYSVKLSRSSLIHLKLSDIFKEIQIITLYTVQCQKDKMAIVQIVKQIAELMGKSTAGHCTAGFTRTT